jgi:DNA polymerase III subunit epsilon
MREIVLDTETTGFEPSEGHRLVEIGCVEIFDRYPTGNIFHAYVNPERDMPAGAFNVHGLSAEFLKDKPLFPHIYDGFVEFLGDANIVIHNAAFDMKFLNAEFTKIGKPLLASSRIIDTLMLARRKHPGMSNTLDALCDRYNIDRSKRVKHGALLDSEMLAEVYSELLGGKQSKMDLNASKFLKTGKLKPAAKRTVAIEPLINDDERVKHAEFIATLGENAVWGKYINTTTIKST